MFLSKLVPIHNGKDSIAELHRQLMVAINHGRGDTLIPMDGDLRNDPAGIPLPLAKLAEGADVVSAGRRRTIPFRG